MNLFVENKFTNPETNMLQTWLPCNIIEISNVINLTKKKGADNELLADDEQTPFRRCVVEVLTPAGLKTIDANLWEASRSVNELVFSIGKECAATFDLEGEYAGSVWLNLPPKRNIDLSWFGVEVEAKAPAEEAKAPITTGTLGQ
jgi:hypothetical protein